MKTPAKSRYSVGADSYRAVVQTLREVQDDLDRPWSLESMAQRAGYDPFHFAHAFRAIVGEAPLLYVRSLRLERAAHDLVFSPEKDLVAIGLEAGYSSSEAFRRAFVKAFNVAPSVIRKNAPTTTALASLSKPKNGTATRLGRPAGVPAPPEIVRFGPVDALSLRAATFSPDAIAAAWRQMYNLVPQPEPWQLGAATPPWGFAVDTRHREYRCLRLTSIAAATVAPPLEAWSASAGWRARIRYQGCHEGLQRVMDWIFGEWLPALALRWRFAPVVTLFDHRVWHASMFKESLCDIHVPVQRLGRGVYAPDE